MKERLALPEENSLVEFIVKRSRDSFFSKLSELSSSQISLEVVRIPNVENYMVFAYSYGRDIDKCIASILNDEKYLTRSKIRRISHWEDKGLHYIIAIKSKCEFFKVAEDSNVAILSPYIFDRGCRKYIALGRRADLENYIEKVLKYYGDRYVSYRWIDRLNHISHILLKRTMLSIIFEKLTDIELKVLQLAYKYGYFDYPRRASQELIGASMNLSKVTVNIHLRKAFKKIVEELMRIKEF